MRLMLYDYLSQRSLPCEVTQLAHGLVEQLVISGVQVEHDLLAETLQGYSPILLLLTLHLLTRVAGL